MPWPREKESANSPTPIRPQHSQHMATHNHPSNRSSSSSNSYQATAAAATKQQQLPSSYQAATAAAASTAATKQLPSSSSSSSSSSQAAAAATKQQQGKSERSLESFVPQHLVSNNSTYRCCLSNCRRETWKDQIHLIYLFFPRINADDAASSGVHD